MKISGKVLFKVAQQRLFKKPAKIAGVARNFKNVYFEKSISILNPVRINI